MHKSVLSFLSVVLSIGFVFPQSAVEVQQYKEAAVTAIDDMRGLTQQMVDMIFSFGELGFQEFETSNYLVNILKENGFEVESGLSGIPTAWLARWGSGNPVIAFGSDLDGIPKASQKPGVAYRDPIVEGAPGHGEGHNSGQAVNVTAALALKQIMEKEGLPGTLILWPGVAEEQLATKAYFIRDGHLQDVDVVLFTHVSSSFNVSFGPARGSGLVSVEYTFHGEAAHAGVAPWRGRSALDAVELMNQAWNYRREHLRLQQRSHYVITNGGDQPNVVPSLASVWYFFREIDFPNIKRLFDIGNTLAEAAAAMTDTKVEWKLLGSAWPRHFNEPIARAMFQNIQAIGLPSWSEADQTLAKAIQKEVGSEPTGLIHELPKEARGPREPNLGGGADDIGDISWNFPAVTLRYPANVPGLPGHHWANAVAMATPIAHKGSTAGAKALAMTALDLLVNPDLLKQAWDYFRDVQGKDTRYTPFLGPEDVPAVHLNKETMEKYRPLMKEYYFDPSQHETYMDQLGVVYPTTK